MYPSALPGTMQRRCYSAPLARIVSSLPETDFTRSNTESINDYDWDFDWD